MLGEISAEYQTAIKKIAKQNNAEIINALKGKCKVINPLEFIWLINNATYVCTDSFHEHDPEHNQDGKQKHRRSKEHPGKYTVLQFLWSVSL